MQPLRYASKVSACRRELNSREAGSRSNAASLEARARNPTIAPQEQGEKVHCTEVSRSRSARRSKKHKYMAPPAWPHLPHCLVCTAQESVFWASAASKVRALSVRESASASRPRLATFFSAERDAVVLAGQSDLALAGSAIRNTRTPMPNPSVEARPNGKPPGPVCGALYSPQPGPGALPSVPPHLER